MKTSTLRIYARNEDGEADDTFQPVEISSTKNALAIPLAFEHGGRWYDLEEVIRSRNVITQAPDYFSYYIPRKANE